MMVTDLDHIKNESRKKSAKLDQFKLKIRNIPVKRFDELAAPIVQEVTSVIDCTQCGNCCKMQEPGVTEEEMIVLSKLKQMDIANFKKEFVAYDHEQVSFLCKQPCTFLNGTICSIYSHRPNSCADFPGLHRPGLKWRIKQMQENYGICPIVFNVVDRLDSMIPG